MALWDAGRSKEQIVQLLGLNQEWVRTIVSRLTAGTEDRRREARIRSDCARYGDALLRTGKVYA
jgi:hypothetical protein